MRMNRRTTNMTGETSFIGLVLLGETLTGGGICRQPPVAVSP